jgi:hypothetical protein
VRREAGPGPGGGVRDGGGRLLGGRGKCLLQAASQDVRIIFVKFNREESGVSDGSGLDPGFVITLKIEFFYVFQMDPDWIQVSLSYLKFNFFFNFSFLFFIDFLDKLGIRIVTVFSFS